MSDTRPQSMVGAVLGHPGIILRGSGSRAAVKATPPIVPSKAVAPGPVKATGDSRPDIIVDDEPRTVKQPKKDPVQHARDPGGPITRPDPGAGSGGKPTGPVTDQGSPYFDSLGEAPASKPAPLKEP